MIEKLTADCPRDDCEIVMGMSSTTCAGWTPTYDKHGRLTNRDPNWTTTGYACNKCGARWRVVSRYGDEPMIEKLATVTPAKPLNLVSGSGSATITSDGTSITLKQE